MSSILTTIGLAFIIIAGLVHVFIFALESLLWRGRQTWRQFGVASEADAEVAQPWAFNQGFYNLFLALGAVVGGVGGIVGGFGGWGWVAVFTALCMIGAAIVLIGSSRGKLLRGALIQGAAPFIGVVLVAITL